MILLTCGILSIFRYKKSEVNIQISTEATQAKKLANFNKKKSLPAKNVSMLLLKKNNDARKWSGGGAGGG